MDLKEYIEFLVSSLVPNNELIKVEIMANEDEFQTVEILVPEDQMKYIIGKGGKNSHALRTLVNSYVYLHKLKKVKINIEAF